MTSFSVHLVVGAKQDLLQLHVYVALNDSLEKADALIDDLQRKCAMLKTMPERGRIPPWPVCADIRFTTGAGLG